MRFNLKMSGPLIGGGLLLLALTPVLPVAFASSDGIIGVAPSQPATSQPPSDITDPSEQGSGSSSQNSDSDETADSGCGDHVSWLALSSGHKESRYANGNPVAVRSRRAILDGMREYAYKDPAGAAQLNAAFQSDTDWSAVNNRVSNYEADHHTWCQETDTMLDMAENADFSIRSVDAGMASLYQVPTSNNGAVPIEIRQGTTSEDGTAAVFTMNGRTVMIRLDCHYQPVRERAFPDVPKVPSATPSHSASPSPAPSRSLAPKVASQDPKARGNAHHGSGTSIGTGTYVAPRDAPSPSVSYRPTPARPTASASQASSGSGMGSGHPSPTPAPSRTYPAPQASQGTADPNDGCVNPPG